MLGTVNGLAQGHTPRKWQSGDLNPERLASACVLIYTPLSLCSQATQPVPQVWCHAIDVSHVVVVAAVVVAAVVVVVVTQGIRTILSLETRGTSGSGRQHPELFFWGWGGRVQQALTREHLLFS